MPTHLHRSRCDVRGVAVHNDVHEEEQVHDEVNPELYTVPFDLKSNAERNGPYRVPVASV